MKRLFAFLTGMFLAAVLFYGCDVCEGIKYDKVEDCFGSWRADYSITAGELNDEGRGDLRISDNKDGFAFISMGGINLTIYEANYSGSIGDIKFDYSGSNIGFSYPQNIIKGKVLNGTVTGTLKDRPRTRCSPANFPDDIFTVNFQVQLDFQPYNEEYMPEGEPIVILIEIQDCGNISTGGCS